MGIKNKNSSEPSDALQIKVKQRSSFTTATLFVAYLLYFFYQNTAVYAQIKGEV